MAAIIIDGYNLIGTAHRDLAHQRDALVARLAAYRKAKGHDLTLVFDGWKAGGARENVTTVGGMQVIYSRLGDTADTVIRRIISADRREWIVVSSDRAVSSHAWAVGSVPVSSDAFLRAVHNALDHPDAGGEPPAPDDEPVRTGGPAHTPSKKERAFRRALAKL